MTYRELLGVLNELSDDQLDMDVSVYIEDQDEFYPMTKVGITDGLWPDVLDEGRPYLIV